MTKSELEKSIDTLPFSIPNGLLLGSADGAEYYLSDGPPPPGLWAQVREQHPRSGLWPALLQGHESAPNRPWVDEDPGYDASCRPEDCDAESVLRSQWDRLAEINFLVPRGRANFLARTAPFDGIWPGLAAPIEPTDAPGAVADELAGRLVPDAGTRLGLLPVARSADVPMITQWWASEEMDTGAATAVLRSWEDRFGARVVQFGYDSLELSVAAPPITPTQAERVAAEHLAFCVENVGREPGALSLYADELIDARHWSFWWSREPPDWLDEDSDLLRPTEEDAW